MNEWTNGRRPSAFFAHVRENWVIYLGHIVLAVLIGTRDLNIGTDTANYARWHEVIADCRCLWGNVELGFNMFSLVISLISNSVVFYFICISLMLFVMTNIISEKVAGLDNQFDHKNKQLILVFILLAFLLSPFYVSAHINAIRQGMAAFVVFYAFLSLCDRGWIKFVIASALAISIHSSSIMYLAIFPLLLLPFRILLAISAGLSLIYAIGFSEIIVRYISDLFNLPLYDYVTGYRSEVTYQGGVRYDFLIFSWLGLLFGLVGRYFSNSKTVLTSLLNIYIVLLIPFLVLGFANFSNRYVYTAWLFLSVLAAYAAYSIPIGLRVKSFVYPYGIIAGQVIFLLMALNGFAK